MAAVQMSAPELMLNEKDAALLADAARNVAQHYDKLAMSDLQRAWLNLAMVTGGLYGSRIMAIRARLTQAAKPKPKTIEFPSAAAPTPKANGAAAGNTPSDFFGREGPSED